MSFFTEEEKTQDPILRYLEPNPNLPPALQEISILYARNAQIILENVPRNPERTVGLRKLLEAKDCFVRALL